MTWTNKEIRYRNTSYIFSAPNFCNIANVQNKDVSINIKVVNVLLILNAKPGFLPYKFSRPVDNKL